MSSKRTIQFLEILPEKETKQWIFLFHGYGADAYDLRSLAEVLGPQDQSTHWIFPQGVKTVPIGPGWTGRAWWDIDLNRFEKAVQDGSHSSGKYEWLDVEPEGLPALREQILQWIGQLAGDWSKVILGGFSQGSMLATDLFLHAPQMPKGLILFSSTLINKAEWQKVIAARKGARFFQSHGRSDPVLPFKAAAQLETFLNQGGMKGSLMPFEGTHEIPMNVIEKANAYLASLS